MSVGVPLIVVIVMRVVVMRGHAVLVRRNGGLSLRRALSLGKVLSLGL